MSEQRGSSGVAGVVKATPGAIGYADVAYALTNKLRFAKVKNKAGAFATPGIRGAIAASKSVKTIPADNAISIVDPPASAGKLAYPISTFVWAIVPLQSKQAKPVKQFLLFAISKTGQALGRSCCTHRSRTVCGSRRPRRSRRSSRPS